MASTMFMRVDEVAEELGVSVPYAYKLIRSMNAELKKTGCITTVSYTHLDVYKRQAQFSGPSSPPSERGQMWSVGGWLFQ